MKVGKQELYIALNLDPKRSPFVHTDASNERENLPQYFIAPPFFEDVWGVPSDPRSCIVFAPTGAGKTAQNVMMQERSKSDADASVMCIVYDGFQRQGITSLANATLDKHLTALIRIGLVAILGSVAANGFASMRFSSAEREMLKRLFRSYLANATNEQLDAAIKSIRTPVQKLSEFVEDIAQAIPVIGPVLKHFGIAEPSSATFEGFRSVLNYASHAGKKKEPAATLNPWVDFESCLEILCGIYGSCYIIVDRVDETSFTMKKADASYKMIQPILTNLELTNPTRGKWAFKFFLWDALRDNFVRNGRTDKIPVHVLDWSEIDLKNLLDARIKYYSHGKHSIIVDLFSKEAVEVGGLPVSDLITYFSNGSPRDSIRICAAVIAEHLDALSRSEGELNENAAKLSLQALERGLSKFSELRFSEAVPDESTRRQLSSIGRVSFTSTYFSTDVQRITAQQAAQKLDAWENSGLIKQVGEHRSGQRGAPPKIYSIKDPRFALVVTNMPLSDFMSSKVKRCNKCKNIQCRDFDIGSFVGNCDKCGAELHDAAAVSLSVSDEAIRSIRKVLANHFKDLEQIEIMIEDAGVPAVKKPKQSLSPEIWWKAAITAAIQAGDQSLRKLISEAIQRLEDPRAIATLKQHLTSG